MHLFELVHLGGIGLHIMLRAARIVRATRRHHDEHRLEIIALGLAMEQVLDNRDIAQDRHTARIRFGIPLRQPGQNQGFAELHGDIGAHQGLGGIETKVENDVAARVGEEGALCGDLDLDQVIRQKFGRQREFYAGFLLHLHRTAGTRRNGGADHVHP